MSGMSPAQQAEIVRQTAVEAGFARVGIAAARPIAHADYFQEWLDRGCAGEMAYLARWRDLRVDPRRLLAGAKSVIVVGHHNSPSVGQEAVGGQVEVAPTSPTADHPRGRVARYAWGRDYHRVVRKMLRRLVARLHAILPGPFETRICVDTAPIVEREAAAAAGIGWIGKNTMIIDSQLGSMLSLGEVVTTLDLEPTRPVKDRCGTCRRCLDACPTGALTAPYRMDASRCISYLTIEHRGRIPPNVARRMGNWVFGCDVCQEVCPYNRKSARPPAGPVNERNPLVPSPRLADLLNLSKEQYDRYVAGSAMRRATLDMLKRNAAIALSNLRRA